MTEKNKVLLRVDDLKCDKNKTVEPDKDFAKSIDNVTNGNKMFGYYK